MPRQDFAYQLVLAEDDPETITSVIAYQASSTSGMRGVLWSVPNRAWIYAPAVIADILYDDLDPMPLREVDRQTAERAAREALKNELPSEAALVQLCEEGERMGWRFGPPSAG